MERYSKAYERLKIKYKIDSAFNDWQPALDNAIYEYMVSSKRSSDTYDQYNQTIHNALKRTYHDCHVHNILVSSLIDTIHYFNDESASMYPEQHHMFSMLLEAANHLNRIR